MADKNAVQTKQNVCSDQCSRPAHVFMYYGAQAVDGEGHIFWALHVSSIYCEQKKAR